MKVWVFSIGESTTELCCELMERYGFEVVLLQDATTLWSKLKRFYTEALASEGDMFMRIDADIIPNSNVKVVNGHNSRYPFWQCSAGFDWYKQDRGPISIHYMNRAAIGLCLKDIDKAEHESRPETFVWRLTKLNPYTHIDWTLNRGLHGYGQIDQRERIKNLKDERHQAYDWELVEAIEAL